MVTTLEDVRQPAGTPTMSGGITVANRSEYGANNPTNATDPSGLVESLAIDRRIMREAEKTERKNRQEGLFRFGSQSSYYGKRPFPPGVSEEDGVFSFTGDIVMSILN